MIVSVNERDALGANKESGPLIRECQKLIGTAITKHRDENSPQRLLKAGGIALGIIICLILAIYGINKLFNFLKHRVLKGKGLKG